MMNAYESQAIKVNRELLEDMKTREENIRSLKEQIIGYKAQLATLIRLASENSELGLELAFNQGKEKIENTLKSLETQKEHNEIYVEKAQVVLKIYSEYFCPHLNRVYDHTDYHRREDYEKCVLCGKII